MTLERMNELVALTDEEKIIAAIEADGYHNCKGDLWYETFPLMDIFHGKSVETKWIPHQELPYKYNINKYTDVKGAPNVEFLAFCVNEIKRTHRIESSIPYHWHMYYKEYPLEDKGKDQN